MSSETIHPLIVRTTHWINAIAIVIMILSGWQIYNASPIIALTFPKWMTLGGWLGGALLWHLAAMWVLLANATIYFLYAILSGRFMRKFFPIRPREVFRDLDAALNGRLSHDDISKYNAVQKLFYVGVMLATVMVVLSGFAIWKPVQLYWLTTAMGGFQGARQVHFLSMAAIVGFLVVHVVLSFLVPKTIRAMIFGR